MLPRTSAWKDQLLAPETHFHGVRMLCRACFVLILVAASVGNEADIRGQAKGMLSVRVEAPSMGLGTHACMQPEAEDIPDEPEPEKPPCPKEKK